MNNKTIRNIAAQIIKEIKYNGYFADCITATEDLSDFEFIAKTFKEEQNLTQFNTKKVGLTLFKYKNKYNSI